MPNRARELFESCVEQGFEPEWESFNLAIALARKDFKIPEAITPDESPDCFDSEDSRNGYADGFNACIIEIIRSNYFEN